VIGVLYAVLLAFIAIDTWESFNKASDIVEAESDYAGGIYLDTQGQPQPKGEKIRDAVNRYVSIVIHDEWPIQRAGNVPDQGWKPLRDLDSAIATIQPQNLGEAVIGHRRAFFQDFVSMVYLRDEHRFPSSGGRGALRSQPEPDRRPACL
jgi:hypothetical protein